MQATRRHSDSWPQVRCMAAVLLMVGRSLEQPSVVQRMLDLHATRQKPQYNMAAEVRMSSRCPDPGNSLLCGHDFGLKLATLSALQQALTTRLYLSHQDFAYGGQW